MTRALLPFVKDQLLIFSIMSVVDELLIDLSVCGPAKYGEASAKASHDQPYVHMIKYSITRANVKKLLKYIEF